MDPDMAGYVYTARWHGSDVTRVTLGNVHVNSSIVTWTDKLAFRIGGATPTFLQIG